MQQLSGKTRSTTALHTTALSIQLNTLKLGGTTAGTVRVQLEAPATSLMKTGNKGHGTWPYAAKAMPVACRLPPM